MSTMPVTRSATPHYASAMANFFRPVRDFYVVFLNARDAAQEAETLFAMSDVALARRGLTRSDIPGYVHQKYM